MNRSRTLAFPAFCIVLAVMLAAAGMPRIAAARTAESPPPDLCLQAAQEAAQETGVPLRLLLALTLTETGRQQDGRLQPWPWALNQGGESLWFSNRDAAVNHLAEGIAQGVGNIDVGCFQLNYRWHGAAFTSLENMIDPHANAVYAARLLARHAAEQGDWVAAAGAYHSSTPDKAETYLARFEPIYAALGASPAVVLPSGQTTLADPAPRPNRFPLLQAGRIASAGSLVPLGTGAGPLFGGP